MRKEREHRYSIYILGSVSGTLYIGITSNLVFRVRQHKDHTFRGFTARYDVDRLLYYETYGEVSTAIAREKQLKGWKREKKVALIEKVNPQWKDLSRAWYEKPGELRSKGRFESKYCGKCHAERAFAGVSERESKHPYS